MENIKEKEVWRDVKGYEGYYQVSDRGNLRRLARTVITSRGSRTYKGRVLNGNINKNTGYRQFCLGINGKSRTFTASQLVAVAFLGHIPDGFKFVVDHVNGNRLDNRVENLRIVTNRANNSYCYRSDRSSLSSKFTGVYWDKNNSKWRARILFEDKNIHLGYYSTEIEASEAYQDALARIEGGTFNPLDYKSKWSSSYKGVGFHKKSNKWQSRVYINGKQKYIGLYPTQFEAHQALQKFKKDNNKLIDKETLT